MNKVFEYSALGGAGLQSSWTRHLLGATAKCADEPTPAGLARASLNLINDDANRVKPGRTAKLLADEKFDWDRENHRNSLATLRAE
jgi:hypothetical protein